MRILFAFENPLPSAQADAEVFTTTARHLAALAGPCAMHVPLPGHTDAAAIAAACGMPVLRAWAPQQPAALRHLCCALTIGWRTAFHDADVIYTRNLLVAWLALLRGGRVVFDHYRPWPDQIPPLRGFIHALMCHPRFVLNICHSHYTERCYRALGVPADRLCTIHNGYDPARLAHPVALADAKRAIGIAEDATTVVYTGRLNHKKGLDLVIAAARRLPGLVFVLVGATGSGPIEAEARTIPNIRLVAWQDEAALGRYVFAADVLLIPPSMRPLAQFGSTVLPLKLFFYLASGRPILAGDTPDVRELLQDGRNAVLCTPDDVDALVAGLTRLTTDRELAARLGATARADGAEYTWDARAGRIMQAIAARLHAPAAAPRSWGAGQRRRWAVQSWRWLGHLLRTRSWVLPPSDAHG